MEVQTNLSFNDEIEEKKEENKTLSDELLNELHNLNLDDYRPKDTTQEAKKKLDILIQSMELKQNVISEINKESCMNALKNSYMIDDKIYFHSNKSGLRLISREKDFKLLLENILKIVNYPKKQKEETKEEEKEREATTKSLKIFIDKFISWIRLQNQYNTIFHKIDPFQKEETNIIATKDILNITTNKIHIKAYDDTLLNETSKDDYNSILKDYMEHWKGKLIEVLEWIMACRFSESRRTSYLHLRVLAGFGKSFFMSIFKEIQVATEINYHDLKKVPSGLNPTDFINAFIMMLDEFKHFPAEFKNLTHAMDIEAKMQLKQTVEVFAKMFFSAEKSASFMGGVDKQISDRVNSIDLDNVVELNSRPLYAKNKSLYRAVIKDFIYKFIINEINNYLKLDKFEANKKADDILESFYQKYKLKVEDLISVIRSTLYYQILEILELKKDFDKLNRADRIKADIAENLIRRDEDTIIITKVARTFENLIKIADDEDFYKKSKYKKTNIEDIFMCEKPTNHKVGSNQHKGIKIELSKLKTEIDKKNIPF